jgi:beta-fructofuranosidase
MSYTATDRPEISYQVDGYYTQDQWFFRKDDWIYFYHLLMPHSAGSQGRWGTEKIAVSRSKDLVRWEYLGWALEPSESPSAWDSKNLATGSTLEWQGRYWMFYCGYNGKPDFPGGFGLAVSDDLVNWTRTSDKPVIDFNGSCYNQSGPFADPYVFFHEKHKCFYMLGTLAMSGEPQETAGCVLLAKSVNLFDWEVLPPLVYPKIGPRLEVPQAWKHNGKWYLIFCTHPCIQAEEFSRFVDPLNQSASFVMMADDFLGPYELKGRWWILPGTGCYTCRVLTDTKGIPCFDGTHAIMTWQADYEDDKGCVRAGATRPWQISYPELGGILTCKPN